MRLSQLLCPNPGKGFIGGLCCAVYGLASHAESGSGRGNKDDTPALGDMGDYCLGEEDRCFNVGIEVRGVYLLGDLVEVGVDSESSTDRR